MDDFDYQEYSRDFDAIMAALGDLSAPLKDRDLCALSNLEGDELQLFSAHWSAIDAGRRLDIMQSTAALSAERLDLVFRQIARVAMHDDDPRVRTAAIDNLRVEEDPRLIGPLLEIVGADAAGDARAAAAACLGVHVYLGEMDELPAARAAEIADALLVVESDDASPKVRMRALESLGYSSRPEVNERIQAAWYTNDDAWQASAVRAMGRSADPGRWAETVLDALTHHSEFVRVEAARAAGDLELESAVPELGEMIYDSAALQQAAVWALGEIGGQPARTLIIELQAVAEHDVAIQSLADEALGKIDLMEGALDFATLDPGDLDEMLAVEEFEEEDSVH